MKNPIFDYLYSIVAAPKLPILFEAKEYQQEKYVSCADDDYFGHQVNLMALGGGIRATRCGWVSSLSSAG
jgi:hypothetical protein